MHHELPVWLLYSAEQVAFIELGQRRYPHPPELGCCPASLEQEGNGFSRTRVQGLPGDRLLCVITGSVAQGLCTAAMLSPGQDIGMMKDARTFEYYASLPISKLNFILALATRAMILALPSSLMLLAAGSLFLGLPARPSPLLALVLICAGYSLAGLGAFVGSFSPDGRVARWTTQLVSPVLLKHPRPYSAAPAGSCRFFPATYVASSLRASLLGQVSAATWMELAGLAGWTVVTLWIASSPRP